MNQTGPAAVLSYLLAGVLVVLIMRMLGEMAVANPTVGSFVEYCRTALGPRAGFTIGWLYWWFWAIVLAIEAVAGATILQRWLPGVPVWAMSLAVMLLLTATNLVSVKSYGEFEFWFASIKVAAIIAFIAICRRLPARRRGRRLARPEATSPRTAASSPEGGITILSGVVIVIFAFVGAEIVTIAAAESDEPERAVAPAPPTRSSAACWSSTCWRSSSSSASSPGTTPSSATRRSSPRWTGSASRARPTS